MGAQENKPIGKTKDVGWQIGARRTLSIDLPDAWKLVTSPEGVKIWLGDAGPLWEAGAYQLPDGTSGEVRVFKPDSHLRLTWQPGDWPRPSTIQVRVIASNAHRTAIAFHQEHLPGPDAREARRSFFQAALDQLEALIDAPTR